MSPPAAAGTISSIKVDDFEGYANDGQLNAQWQTIETPDPILLTSGGAGGGQAMALSALRAAPIDSRPDAPAAVPNGSIVSAPIVVTNLSVFSTLTVWYKAAPTASPGDTLTVKLVLNGVETAVGVKSNYNTTTTWTRWDVDISFYDLTNVTAILFDIEGQFDFTVDQPLVASDLPIVPADETIYVDQISFNNGALWLGDMSTANPTASWDGFGNWDSGPPAAQTAARIPTFTPNNNWPELPASRSVGSLIVEPGAELYLGTYELAVSGAVNNDGRIQQIRNIVGGGDNFVFLGAGYSGLTIATGDALTERPAVADLGITTVDIYGNQTCPGAPNGIKRCFVISPTNPPLPSGKDVIFYFTAADLNGNTCADLKPYHFNSGTGLWEALTSYRLDCDSAQKSLIAYNVTDFSPFTLGSEVPTAVSLTQVGAAAPAPALAPALLLLLLALSAAFVLRFRK